jgi:hypothetical protein
MAIRCSIVGCEYDDTHIEREEERRGEEVILTVREFKECARCGNTELISENTGVTSAPRPETEDDADAEEASDEGTVEHDEPTTGGEDATEPAEPTTPTTSDSGSGTDDAVILDDGPGTGGATPDPERGRPAAPDPEPATPESTAETDATGTVANGGSEPAEPATPEADAGPPADDADEQVTDDAVFIDDTGDRTGGLDEAASMDDEPTIASGTTDAEEEYPEDDAVILESSGSDARSGTGVGVGDNASSESAGGGDWPEYDDHRGTRTGGETPTTDAGQSRETGRQRSTGETRSTGTETGTTDSDWPDVGDADQGWDASPDTENVAEDVDFSGLTPEADGGGAVTTERPLSGSSEAVEAGTEPGRDAGRGETTRSRAGGLHCTGCGNAVDRDSSPHRAGDVCPDCSREYLTER